MAVYDGLNVVGRQRCGLPAWTQRRTPCCYLEDRKTLRMCAQAVTVGRINSPAAALWEWLGRACRRQLPSPEPPLLYAKI